MRYSSTTTPLHKKGILVVYCVILTESLTLTRAVHFWSTYQNWSKKYGRDSFQNHRTGGGTNADEEVNQSKMGAFFSSVKSSLSSETSSTSTTVTSITTECSGDSYSSSKTCKASSTSSSKTPKHNAMSSSIHPRKSSRPPKTYCSKDMFHCCAQNSPQCMIEKGVVGRLLSNRTGRSLGLGIRGGHNTILEAATSGSSTTMTSPTTLPTPYNLPLNIWKVIFQVFLTTINVAFWLIPLRAKKITENKLVLGLANAFSGGVFLSLAFGHLIPECVHGFDEGMNEALPYMIVLGGYLLIFFVEKVAFDAHGLMHECGDEDSNDQHVHTNGKEVIEINEKSTSGGATSRSAVILLGALAVHSILEMTALGLAKSFGDSALLTLSIALHQPAESIALLVAFLKSGMPKNDIIKYLSVFSTMGPIGVAIGMAVTEFAAPIVDSIMLATVAGTFIYVGATEVIPEEWEEQENKWMKFFALMSGIISIFAITQYTMTLEGHSH